MIRKSFVIIYPYIVIIHFYIVIIWQFLPICH